MEKTKKYQCTLKLFDSSLNLEKTEPMTAVIFGKTLRAVPHITEIGTIIRLHRANTRKYKKITQINCDVSVKSAWVLFDPNYGTSAINESGKAHTSAPEDKTLISDLRKCAKNYFAKNELKFMSLKEAEKKKPKDFDTLCYVVDVKKRGNGLKVTLRDGSKTVKLAISEKSKFLLSDGDIVRIRSANYTDKKCDSIELNEYSNILKVSDESKSAKELLKKIDM